jgi:hypothetical protein
MARGVDTLGVRARGGRRSFGIGGALALAVVLVAAPVGAAADDVGGAGFEIAPGLAEAKSAFELHAKSWMADLEKSEAENRRKAPVYGVADEAVIRFDGYGDEYETQVKATGHAAAPYVGILRYRENLYTCLRNDASRCTVTRSVPVSEIFSFKNGRWTY